MSRPFIRDDLPPTTEAFASVPPFRKEENHTQRTQAVLREICQSLRGSENKVFYSMRQVSDALGVPLRTTTVAYKTLEKEGLLLRIRGSHTILLGKTEKTSKPKNWTVGFPIWMEGFSHFAYRRELLKHLSDALCSHSIATDPVFFWNQEDFSHRFIERLLAHEMDVCVWLQPVHWHYNLINSIRDHGIKNIIITDAELEFMPSEIIIDREAAYKAVFRNWIERHTIEEIFVLQNGSNTEQRIDYLMNSVSEYSLKWNIRDKPSRLLAQKARTASVVLDQIAAIKLVHHDPAFFLELTKNQRILFARDCPIIPYPLSQEVLADIIHFPTEPVCRHLVNCLLKWFSGNTTPDTAILEAEVNLSCALPSIDLSG